MKEIEVTLISGRTSKQGIGLEEGKTSENYVNSVNLIYLNPNDVEKLQLNEDHTVKVMTDKGSIYLHWVADKNIDKGLAFIPYGPWANQVYSSLTEGTGMPMFKGVKAKLTSSSESVPDLKRIVESLREVN
jgi:formylmethanofuran dehydrogenase subunit D